MGCAEGLRARVHHLMRPLCGGAGGARAPLPPHVADRINFWLWPSHQFLRSSRAARPEKKKRKVRPMGQKKGATKIVPEQNKRICASICVCQLIAVLSCVSIVYLSVAVYAPAHKLLESGYETVPATCQTHELHWATTLGDWSSCGEWCLSKSSPPYPQIHVVVRRNGTTIRLDNCTRTASVACPPADEESLRKYNCNQDQECETITGVFSCKRGHCANLSEIYSCQPNADGNYIDADRDNLKLNGFFECQKSRCRQIKKTPFPCDRYCPRITTSGINVILFHGDTVLTAECSRAYTVNDEYPMLTAGVDGQAATTPKPFEEQLMWTPDKGVMMAACMKAERSSTNQISANDCVNGTLVDEARLPAHYMNFTYLWALFEESQTFKPDPELPPPQQDLVIYNTSRLLINLDGCVNTLRGECNEFVKNNGKDGTNHTGQSRFQCFYHRDDPLWSLARFDLERTRIELILFSTIPVVLAVVSCTSLIVCTKIVKVGDDAKMRIKIRGCCGANQPPTNNKDVESSQLKQHDDKLDSDPNDDD